MRGGGIKLCRTCRYFRQATDGYDFWSECIRPLNGERSIVTGELTNRLHADCERERRSDWTLFTRRLRCGPSGRFHEDA